MSLRFNTAQMLLLVAFLATILGGWRFNCSAWRISEASGLMLSLSISLLLLFVGVYRHLRSLENGVLASTFCGCAF